MKRKRFSILFFVRKVGTSIPLVTDNTAWGSLTTPGYCWYDNYDYGYGALYNWYTVNTNKLCPIGWHVPALLNGQH